MFGFSWSFVYCICMYAHRTDEVYFIPFAIFLPTWNVRQCGGGAYKYYDPVSRTE